LDCNLENRARHIPATLPVKGPGSGPEHRRLARPVGPEQSDALSSFDAKRKVANGGNPIVVETDVLQFEYGRQSPLPPCPRHKTAGGDKSSQSRVIASAHAEFGQQTNLSPKSAGEHREINLVAQLDALAQQQMGAGNGGVKPNGAAGNNQNAAKSAIENRTPNPTNEIQQQLFRQV